MSRRPPYVRARLESLRALWMASTLALFALAGCDRGGLYDGPKIHNPSEPPPPPVVCPPPRTPSQLKVKVNEAMLENASALADEYGRYPPWVELHNATDEEMDLGDVALSDSFVDVKWRIPCGPKAKVPPRGFLVIFLDGGTSEEDDFHAEFAIEPGKPFTIVVNKGSDVFSFDGSKLGPDVSAGRHPDGASRIEVLSEPTPGGPNAEPAGEVGPAEGTFVRGDANEDGRVNLSDMTRILQVLYRGAAAPACEDRMDANDDARVDASDPVYVGNALFSRGPTFPPPFPGAGVDPTPDALRCPPN
ncbi:MAG: dockerin type I domain-containing protein [Planctomycetota bacterium]